MDVTMAVVQSLGMLCKRGGGGSGRRRRGTLFVAMLVLTAAAPLARAADDVQWVAPAMLDDVPVRAAADASPDPVAPEPIVVPLPPGLATGAIGLVAMAASQWWTKRRRR